MIKISHYRYNDIAFVRYIVTVDIQVMDLTKLFSRDMADLVIIIIHFLKHGLPWHNTEGSLELAVLDF